MRINLISGLRAWKIKSQRKNSQSLREPLAACLCVWERFTRKRCKSLLHFRFSASTSKLVRLPRCVLHNRRWWPLTRYFLFATFYLFFDNALLLLLLKLGATISVNFILFLIIVSWFQWTFLARVQSSSFPVQQ